MAVLHSRCPCTTQDERAWQQALRSRRSSDLTAYRLFLRYSLVQLASATICCVVRHFGVLLAADAQTQSAYPWLPLAPQAEVNAVNGG